MAPDNNRENMRINFSRLLSQFLIIACAIAGVQFFLVMREPQKWLLVPQPWMGNIGIQRLMHIVIGSAPALWVAFCALLGLELDKIAVRSANKHLFRLENIAYTALWLLGFLGGPLVVSRLFPARFPTTFLPEHPFWVAIPSVAFALMMHTAILSASRSRQSGPSLSIAVLISGTATFLALILANIYWLPGFLSPVSLIWSGIMLIVGMTLFWLLCRIDLSRLEQVLQDLSDSVPLKPASPAIALVIILALAAASGLPSSIPGIGPKKNNPNVVLITLDTLRADHMSGYGYFLPTTPNLDRLANEGTMFSQCISSAPQTVPAIASIMTSKYPSFHSAGKTNGQNAFSPEEQTLAQTLRKNGFYCNAFVGNYVLSRKLGLIGGFDIYDDTFTSTELIRSVPERTAADTTEYALNSLSAMSNRHFFLWVHYQDPHGPYSPPESYITNYPETAYADAPGLSSLQNDIDREQIPDYQYFDGHRSIRFYRSRYDAEIAYADENIGRLLDGIKALNLWEETIIIFTSDHGESMGEHNYFFQHGQDLTEDLIHVPLIIHIPSTDQVRRVDDLVSNVDIVPTILDVLGLENDLQGAGISLMPLIQGKIERLAREHVVAEDDHGRLCLRSREAKYIDGPDGERLYDLALYPAESDNILDKNPDLAAPWRVSRDEYKESIKPILGRQLHYNREEAENLKALGYIN